MSTFIIDVDGTICDAPLVEGRYDYPNAVPITETIERIKHLKESGHTIVLNTSRGMRTYRGDRDMIEVNVRPIMEEWLKKHDVPYDSLHMCKPWGPDPIYVDNRNLSLKSFVWKHPDQFETIIQEENTI